MKNHCYMASALILAVVLVTGCGKPDHATSHDGHDHGHAHKAPHGGTVVALGEAEHHLEFVLDRATGRLTAYVLDGHLEKFVRLTAPSFEVVTVQLAGEQTLTLVAQANPATGETVGDTSQFSAQAEWLKNARSFDAEIQRIAVRGKAYDSVKFNFPRGNEPTKK